MFTGLAQQGTKALGGPRFALVNILPGAVLVTFVTALVLAGAYGTGQASLGDIARNLVKFPGGPTGAAVTFVFGTFLLGVLLRPFQVALVQMLEGYWATNRPAALASEFAIERHRRRRKAAEIQQRARATKPLDHSFAEVAGYARRQARAERIRREAHVRLGRYPREERVLPTTLGNILRSGEDSAGQRYGLDSATVYPRMYPSLSKTLDSAMSRQFDIIDTTSALCITFLAAGTASVPLLGRLDWWSLVPAGMFVLAQVAYRGALQAAEGHTVLLATAFDLHRFDMLARLHYPLPETPEEEFEFNKRLSRFLHEGNYASVMLGGESYKHPSAGPDAP